MATLHFRAPTGGPGGPGRGSNNVDSNMGQPQDGAGSEASLGAVTALVRRRREYRAVYLRVKRLAAWGWLPGLPWRAAVAQRSLRAIEDGMTLHDVMLFRWWAWAVTPPWWRGVVAGVAGAVGVRGAEGVRLWKTQEEMAGEWRLR